MSFSDEQSNYLSVLQSISSQPFQLCPNKSSLVNFAIFFSIVFFLEIFDFRVFSNFEDFLNVSSPSD